MQCSTLLGLQARTARAQALTVLVLLLLLGNTHLWAQNEELTDWSRVDSIVAGYPDRPLRVKGISNRIRRDFTLPEERARAVFTWIATHVAYDVKALTKKKKKGRNRTSKNQDRLYNRRALKSFWRKKAVCDGYSRLYKKMAVQCGLECVVLSGESKTKPYKIGNQRFHSSHAWNAVKMNGEWKLLDATWGAGGVGPASPKEKKIKKHRKKRRKKHRKKKKEVFTFSFKDIYFFTDPELFSLNHFPKDTSYLLCNRSYDDFSRLPLCPTYMLQKGILITDSTEGVIWTNQGDTFSIYLNDRYELKDLEFKFGREQWDHPALEAYANTAGGHTFHLVNPGANADYLFIYWYNNPIAVFRIRLKPF